MNTVFVDTAYWVAVFIPGDQWRSQALTAAWRLGQARLVTTEEVLTEFLNFASGNGHHARRLAAEGVQRILHSPDVEVIPQSHESFSDGIRLYEQREDKLYSLTDCISMNAMAERGIVEVLTQDHYFEQAGYVALLRA